MHQVESEPDQLVEAIEVRLKDNIMLMASAAVLEPLPPGRGVSGTSGLAALRVIAPTQAIPQNLLSAFTLMVEGHVIGTDGFKAEKLFGMASEANAAASAAVQHLMTENGDRFIGMIGYDHEAIRWLCKTERIRWRNHMSNLSNGATVSLTLLIIVILSGILLLKAHGAGWIAVEGLLLISLPISMIGGGALFLSASSLMELSRGVCRGYCPIAEDIMSAHGGNIMFVGRRGIYLSSLPAAGGRSEAEFHPYETLRPPFTIHGLDTMVLEFATSSGSLLRTFLLPKSMAYPTCELVKEIRTMTASN